MISNTHSSDHIVSTHRCFICEKDFLFGEIILRYSNINEKTYMYYHPTCLKCIKCQRKLLNDDKKFFNMIYYSGKFRADQVLCDQCTMNSIKSNTLVNQLSEDEYFLQRKNNKVNSYKLFSKISTDNYNQLLFSHQHNKLKIDDEHIINIRKLNNYKKTDLNSSLTCCQKYWTGLDEINPRQCAYCHRNFTRFDKYLTSNHIDFYCNLCWIYQKDFMIKNEKQSLSSSIRCNLCGQVLLGQLTDDIIAMNFVHPTCIEKHLDQF